MGYLYDHDDVESLGFGINSCDYDGLDYEDRCDQISSALINQGLSIDSAFNSDDTDYLSVRCVGRSSTTPYTKSTNTAKNYVSYQTFPITINKRRKAVEATMTYVVDSETSKITVTRVCFRPIPSFPRRSEPSFDTQNYPGRCSALRTYSTMERAIHGVEVFAIDSKHYLENLIWQPVTSISLGKRGDRCKYSIKALHNGLYGRDILYGLMITNGHEYHDITPFVWKFTHAGLHKVIELLNDPIFMSGVVEYYYNGGEGFTTASLVNTLFSASYYYDANKVVATFSEKYKSRAYIDSCMEIYESRKSKEGCRLRLYTNGRYIAADCRIVAYEIRCGGRVIYCKDDLDIPCNRGGWYHSVFDNIFDDPVVRCIMSKNYLPGIRLDNEDVDFGHTSD